ncbi:DinB family protein [Vogesella facilis]|uniref:DinB family protein n=1 Tax=Vogesella facilis TaxID=1655232 RepID=A0ABV7RE08_9NEIS
MHNRFDQFRLTALGQQLEALIDSPQRYTEYAALSRAEIPAVSAIVHDLQSRFPELAADQTARQFCGAMVGDVMRRHGHALLRPRGRVPGSYFSYGAVWSPLPQQRSFAELLQQLAAMPALVQHSLAAVPAAQRRQRPAGTAFSALEHLCHLRDLDRDAFLPRVQAMRQQQQAALHGVNGSVWAVERDYQAQDWQQAVDGFAAARQALLAALQDCDAAAQARIAVWEGVRRLTLAELVADMAAHDATHLQEIDELLAALAGEAV